MFVIILLAFLSVIFGNSFIGSGSQLVYDNTLIINGTTSTLGSDPSDSWFNIDAITGLLVVITIITTVALVFGIQVVGSGLGDSTVRTITIITAFTGIYTVFSILAFNLITSIEVFGSLIYIGLTVMYVYGVAQKIAGGE